MVLSRRGWIAAASGVGAAAVLGDWAGGRRLRILVLGGTRFVGRHIVAAALVGGHVVTLFNRGRSGPGLFPGVEALIGDREGDHAGLRGRRWDAVVDTSGTEPGWAGRACAVLAGAVDRYVYFSSIAVYAGSETARDEDSALRGVAADGPRDYGEKKVASERVIAAAFGERAMIVRPAALVGPFDTRFRFVRWGLRAREGGELLAPGRPEDVVPLADARDVAAWIVGSIAGGTTGTFNVADPRWTTGDLIAAAGGSATPVWVEATWLAEQKADFDSLPSLRAGAGRAVIADRALAAGLRCRPLAGSMADTLAWWDAEPGTPKVVVRMTRERELELLAAWRARSG
jgi:2'-hydroxyisoflavone reductase